MTELEKLIDLLLIPSKTLEHEDAERIAKYMISHGVTVKEPNKTFTLEEVFEGIKEGRIFYIEDKEEPSNTGWDECGAVDYWLNKGINKYDMREDYGKNWRCWAKKPTEEEMNAAEWEE